MDILHIDKFRYEIQENNNFPYDISAHLEHCLKQRVKIIQV
jgi:hypothetical protein